MKKYLYIIVPVIVCLLVGFLGGEAQRESLATWYPTIVKSPLTPPNIVFPIVWTTLYILMGVSIGLILMSGVKNKSFLVKLFCVQLFVNWLWSTIFFNFQNPAWAFVDVILLDILVLWYAVASYRALKLSSVLVWPYAAWILFATYLNLFIVFNN